MLALRTQAVQLTASVRGTRQRVQFLLVGLRVEAALWVADRRGTQIAVRAVVLSPGSSDPVGQAMEDGLDVSGEAGAVSREDRLCPRDGSL